MFIDLLLIPIIILFYNLLAYYYFGMKKFNLGFHIIVTLFPIIYIYLELFRNYIQNNPNNIFIKIFGIICTFIAISSTICRLITR